MSNLKHLEETLAVYGTCQERWPEGHDAELEDVLRSPAGREMCAEAAALERVLDAGVMPDLAIGDSADDLVSRIVAATVDAEPVRQHVPPVSRGRRVQRVWGVGATMAAMLCVGVFAGVNGFGAIVTTSGIDFAQGEQALSAEDALLADLNFSSDPDLEDDV